MKTNVVMVRKLQNFDILQRTSDGMFNASELLKQWNKKSGSQKNIDHFFENQGTSEFLQVLEQEENLIIRNSERPNSQAYIKTKCKTNKDGSKIPGETWMHPILFIKFAMWINPKFEYFVIKFVYDELIKYRHDAGDNYRGLSKSLCSLPNVNYSQVAKALNHIVFRRHDDNLRQRASQEQLKELTTIEGKLSFAIDMGYIRSFNELMRELRKMYAIKYGIAA